MRIVEVIIAVGILAVGISGINIYLSTQPANVQPPNLTPEASTVLSKLQASEPLTCSPSQKQLVEEALYVLLPPNIHYNFTVYSLRNGGAAVVYSVANSGETKTFYQTTVEIVLSESNTPQAPGSKLDIHPLCFGVLSVGVA